jgi:integrase
LKAKPTIYLNDAEIEQIANLDLTDSKKTVQITRGKIVENVSYLTLDKTRDLALIGFYSGLRFSDFSKLELKNIDKDFIKAKQLKTGKYVVIPIMKKLRPILEKYKDGLPTLSNQRFNDYIKLVAELAGLTENRTIKNTKGNIESETTAPLYTLISSHCCRRSYATNLFNAGYSPMLIMSATGHKTETSFLKYIRATNEDKAKLLAQAFEKSGL